MRAAVGAQADAAIGAGEHARRIGRIHRQAADHAVELDGFLQTQPVPARAVVDTAQYALSGRSHQ